MNVIATEMSPLPIQYVNVISILVTMYCVNRVYALGVVGRGHSGEFKGLRGQ